ncbi:ABC transporter permease [Mesorhizobium sp. 1B3]|uniref:ABC transporter permease n=1 Tax=Mesorhizobium sp. 1B3 TaxID=3243599 RepID=UPI003D972266
MTRTSFFESLPGQLVVAYRQLDLTILVWIVIALALAFLTVNPVLSLLVDSFRSIADRTFTLQNYVSAFTSPVKLSAVWTTALYAAGVSILTAILAVPTAWAVSRTDMPLKGFVRVLVLGSFILPSYLGAVAWILIAGPNSGWLNIAWRYLTGFEGALINVYSFSGLVFVTALYSYAFVFVFASDGFDRLSSEMEDAANILGAGPVRTTLRITMPLVAPAIIGGMIVTFLETFTLFGTPAILALPARINVMTLELWSYFQYPVNPYGAAAYALPLIGITCLLFLLQRLYFGRKGYVTISGKTTERRLIALGKYKWVFLGYSLAVSALALGLPLVALTQAAFTTAWGRKLSFDNLTLENFRYALFENDATVNAIANTALYSSAAATLAVILSLAVAYVVARRLLPFAGTLGMLCMAPFVIPGIVIAIGFYSAYANAPFYLYGTGAIIIIAFTTRFLPIAYVNSTAGMKSLNPEMEDAVRILGGSRIRALRSVVMPLLKGSIAGSWMLVFIPAIRELSSALFLITPNTKVVSILILDYSQGANFEILSAIGLITLVASVCIYLISRLLIGRDVMLRKQ